MNFISDKIADELEANKISVFKKSKTSIQKQNIIKCLIEKTVSISSWFTEIKDAITYSELFEAVSKLKIKLTNIFIENVFNENFKSKYDKMEKDRK